MERCDDDRREDTAGCGSADEAKCERIRGQIGKRISVLSDVSQKQHTQND